MKIVFKLMLVFAVLALLAGFECLLYSCNLVAYPVPKRALIHDNTKPVVQKQLTLLVYMAADNDLESYAISNLKAMERADFSGMNVLVLLDRSEGYDETNDDWTDTRLFEVTHDETNGSSIVSKRLLCPPLGLTQDSATELDMGNSDILKTFIEFGKAEYPATEYALIIWGHGTGWRYCLQQNDTNSFRAVAIDDKSNSYICVKELGLALRAQELSVIGFDTCFGSTFENLYELKDCAQYIAASPGLTPATGWDYKTLLQNLCTTNFSAQEIADTMGKSAMQNITVTSCSELPAIMTQLEAFSKALADTIYDEQSRRTVLDTLVNTRAYSYTQFPCDMYLDLFSMAQAYSNSTNSELCSASQKLKETTSFMQIGILFIPKTAEGVFAASHSLNYIKNEVNQTQCSFIKESNWWVPTKNGNSNSLLDKLFYWNF